jgi:DNA-binding PadR family transcriptional regulator
MAREQFQTLTESMYYILLALRNSMHGYEIMQSVQKISDNRVVVGAGTLYALLTRFESEKYIEMVNDDGRRKTYRLTDRGNELLKREYERLKTSVAAYESHAILESEQ